MKKELIFSKKVLVLIVGIMIICAGMQKPENTVREEKGYNYETTKDKVRFEGVGKITSESSTEIAV